jgi:hypothetical protein
VIVNFKFINAIFGANHPSLSSHMRFSRSV